MAELFEFSSLAEVVDFKNGKSLKKSLYSEKGKYPIYGSNGVISYTDEKKYDLPVVVIGRVGAYCGSIYLTNGPAWITDNAIIATTKTEQDIRFFYYLLKNMDLGRTAIGSAQPLLTQSGLNVVKARLAPQLERKAIASVLGALDDKIENNRRLNETLEEMARAIFKSWFVDFDPVHAKAAGNAPAHMDADTAALFPSSFGDDGLPTGWKKQDIGLLVEIRKGLSYKGKFLSDGGVGMINLGCFGFRGSFKPEKIKSYTGEFKDRHKIKSGDLIFANTDMTQDRAILCSPVIVPSYIDEGEAIFSHHVSHVHFFEVQQPAFTEFLRHFMMTPDFRMRAEGYATGNNGVSSS